MSKFDSKQKSEYPVTDQEREIPKYLNRIEKQLSQCFESFNTLRDQLNPIVANYPEDCGEKDAKSICDTELGGRLCDIFDRLTAFDGMISKTTRGLEL